MTQNMILIFYFRLSSWQYSSNKHQYPLGKIRIFLNRLTEYSCDGKFGNQILSNIALDVLNGQTLSQDLLQELDFKKKYKCDNTKVTVLLRNLIKLISHF